jgi:hypothetical protein
MHMRFIALATTMLTALVTGSFAYGRAGTAGPCSSGTTASTASYKMALDIGKQEDMYLPSEVKARHITDGEIMLGGEMAMVNPTAGTRVYHLEVHICNKSGAVVTKLKPSIVVGPTMLPAAIMVGIGAPMSDYHYGNDIVLKPGARVTVKVTVKGQVAVFHATAPKT